MSILFNEELNKWKNAMLQIFGRSGAGTTLYIIFLVVYSYSDAIGIDEKIVTVSFGFIINLLMNTKDATLNKLGKDLLRAHNIIFLLNAGSTLEEAKTLADQPILDVTQLIGKKTETTPPTVTPTPITPPPTFTPVPPLSLPTEEKKA